MNRVVLHDARRRVWRSFRKPEAVLTARTLADVLPLLADVERQVERRGWTAAGFISYEASPAFDSALAVRPDARFPLAWFGLYRGGMPISAPRPPRRGNPLPSDWQPSVTPAAYAEAIRTLKRYIHAGDTYQANYTYRLTAPFTGDPCACWAHLVATQGGAYAALVETGDWTLCSASPELFFALRGTALVSRPMKGTAARGLDWAADRRAALALQRSPKNRAENVMIVDMVRNDVGRVAAPGTVAPGSLFAIERYPAMWQMVSVVHAETAAGFPALLQALFPAASITGAPKPHTMALLAALETTPRRSYTGAIGFLAPGREAQFNVAIRTLLVDHAVGRAEYGVGGGIVWDSGAAAEARECRTKAHVLARAWPRFALLETLRWAPRTGYTLLARHLERLRRSAVYFGFALEPAAVSAALARLAGRLPPAPHRVRVRVTRDGRVRCQSFRLPPRPSRRPLRVALAAAPVAAADVWLYHKTTHRAVYKRALRARPDCDDVILWNGRGEVTEGCLANVVVERDGRLCTPPVRCGLLAGTFRAELLASGQVVERVIRVDELARCPRLYLVNAVRGLRPARLVE